MGAEGDAAAASAGPRGNANADRRGRVPVEVAAFSSPSSCAVSGADDTPPEAGTAEAVKTRRCCSRQTWGCRCPVQDSVAQVKLSLFAGTMVFVWVFVVGNLAEQGRRGVVAPNTNMTETDAALLEMRNMWGWRVFMSVMQYVLAMPIMMALVYIVHGEWMPLRAVALSQVVPTTIMIFTHAMAVRWGPTAAQDQMFYADVQVADPLDDEAFVQWAVIENAGFYQWRALMPAGVAWILLRNSPDGRQRNKKAGPWRLDEVMIVGFAAFAPLSVVISMIYNIGSSPYTVLVILVLTPWLRYVYGRFGKRRLPPSLPYLVICLQWVDAAPYTVASFFRLQTAETALLWMFAYEVIASLIHEGWRCVALLATGNSHGKADLFLFEFRVFHLMLSELIFLSVQPLGASFFLLMIIEDVYMLVTFSGLGAEVLQALTKWKLGFTKMSEKQLRLLTVDAEQYVYAEMLAVIVVLTAVLSEHTMLTFWPDSFRPLLTRAADSDDGNSVHLLIVGYLLITASQLLATLGVQYVLRARAWHLARDLAQLARDLEIVPLAQGSQRGRPSMSSQLVKQAGRLGGGHGVGSTRSSSSGGASPGGSSRAPGGSPGGGSLGGGSSGSRGGRHGARGSPSTRASSRVAPAARVAISGTDDRDTAAEHGRAGGSAQALSPAAVGRKTAVELTAQAVADELIQTLVDDAQAKVLSGDDLGSVCHDYPRRGRSHASVR